MGGGEVYALETEGAIPMEESLYIVIHRYPGKGPWRADEVFTEERLARNQIEIKRLLDTDPKYEYAYVVGPIVNPEQMAEAEARLGPFTPETPAPEPQPATVTVDDLPF
jgi:hypothetical protein